MKDRIEYILVRRGYFVSEEGQMFNPKGKSIGTVGKTCGRVRSTIRVNKKQVNTWTHRLQAFQKYGSKLFEEGIVTRHLDGNPLNNSWDNIVIGTHSDNMMDIPEQIRIKKALHATSFWRKHDRKKIKEFHSIDRSYKKTMEKFNISSKGTLHFILNN